MTPAALALVAEFEAAAKVAQAAEADLRKTMAEQIGRLERQRHFAFRRTRLIRALAAAASAADRAEEESEVGPDAWPAMWKGQRRAVRDELGWTGQSAAYDAILDRLEPVGEAVWRCAASDDPAAPGRVQSALAAFETWFEGVHGKSFYALFDVYAPEVPVVDF